MTMTGFGSSVGVFGKLGSVTLHDLIQMLSLGKRSATLTLRRGNEHGHLYFRDGEILHAEAGPFQGEDGILELLQWQDADFRIEEGVASLPRITIGKRVDAVLLGTLTRLDHLNHVRGASGPLREPVGTAPSPPLSPSASRAPGAESGPARGATPPRRYPRRPSSVRARSRSISVAATLLVVAALAAASLLVAPYAAGAIVPWVNEPWAELPAVAGVAGTVALDVRPRETDAWAMLATTRERDRAPTSAPSVPAPRGAGTAPAPPADAAPGFLTVVVEPWGRVFIDGRLVGETPLGKQELPAGEHELRLENDNVVGVVQDRVNVEAGAALVRRYDFSDVGYLQFLATPWAEVSVDGRPVGETPLARVSVPVGQHGVVMEHPRFGRHERTVDVRLGETTIVEQDWGPRP